MSGDDASRLEAFLAGLEQLPPTPGVSLRGCVTGAEFVRSGQSVVTRQVIATSRNLMVATENETVSSLYAVLGRSGRNLVPFSARREDQEVAFLPATLFHLVETRVLADREVHLVVELDPASPRLADDVPDRLAARVEEALLAEAAAPRPASDAPAGKFAGDIG